MNKPVVVTQKEKKTVRFEEPVGQIRIAEWMALESRSKKLEEEERQVEEDARALEKFIRELARTPQQLVLQKPRIQQVALNIRQRREDLLRSREAIEEERRVFWESNRQKSRASLTAEVSATSESNFYTGITGDIAEGGLFVATDLNHQPGTLIDLTLSLPGHSPLRLAGEVRWIREYSEFTEDMAPGLGVGFLNLPDEARRAISGFIDTRQPLFYELD
jgi:uncharacterized protein (TIGR02266 family)